MPGQDLSCGIDRGCGEANAVAIPVWEEIKSGKVQREWGVDAPVVNGARGGLADSHGNGVPTCELPEEHESLACHWEMEEASAPIGVKGRLRNSLSFWRDELRAPQSVLDIIDRGYVLPLISEPTAFTRKNQASANTNKMFVEQCIDDLVVQGCIREVTTAPHIGSPLSVVEGSTGKKRLVVNLRHLNRFLWKQKFKYEDLRVALQLFEKGDFLFSLDLKSGYHHVDIADIHHKYLGFTWANRFYVFTVLPFGLASACYMFTKLLRPLVGYWRSKGLRTVVYLDDGLCMAPGQASAKEASALVRASLGNAGFVTHPDKSVWEPTQCLTWLGFVIDLAQGEIRIPEPKVAALREALSHTKEVAYLPAKRIASIVGRLISMSLAIGPVARFMTRSLYTVLDSRSTWCEYLLLSPEARDELKFWEKCLADYDSQPIWRSPSAMRVVYSDASETGYGGYVVEHGPCMAYGQWTSEEAKSSSTWRELAAVYGVLSAVASKLSNTRVRWFTDNQNMARILLVGSKKDTTCHSAKNILSVCAVRHTVRTRMDPPGTERKS